MPKTRPPDLIRFQIWWPFIIYLATLGIEYFSIDYIHTQLWM